MLIQQFQPTQSFSPVRYQAAPAHFSTPGPMQSAAALGDTVVALQQVFQGFSSFAQGQAPSREWLEIATEKMHIQPPPAAPRNERQEILAEKDATSPSQQALRVAVIDDFVAEDNGFNHGEMVTSIIEGGGALGNDHPVETLRFNIDQPGQDRTKMISSSLQQILAKVRSGEEIDAVNLSQQAFTPTETTRRINSQIDQLEDLGVAVVVAAGNEAGKVNELGRSADIVVENVGEDGKRAATSGKGNVRAKGDSTSKASANFAPVAAFRKAKSRAPRSAALAAVAYNHADDV